MADPRDVVVPEDLAGERVDKAVAALFEVSRSVARHLVEQNVTVDGARVSPSDRVAAGSVISATVPDLTEELESEDVAFDVLYEDSHLLVVDKPAGVFTSTSSAHGGQESTLLSMTLPLLHHGMLIVGVPYTETALFETRTGGSPYGASHLATGWNTGLSKDESDVAKALGARVARLAIRLASRRSDGEAPR